MHCRLLAFALMFIVCLATPSRSAETRVALVVGNSAYRNTTALQNPANDAEDMTTALKGLGFQVLKGTDLDKAGFDRKVSEFASSLKGAKLAVFFYAGHGLQVAGQNYLVPVDAKLDSPSALDFEAVRLDLIQRTMERETETSVLFLDACRDNPLSRNLARSLGTRSTDIGRGLAAQESGSGTLISFSTQPGNVALDGTGSRNSPFAAALSKYLPAPGDDLSATLIKVRNDVMQATADRQVPWEHSALRAKLYLTSPTEEKKAPNPEPAPAPAESAAPANRSVAQVRVANKQLATLADGALRLKVTDAYAPIGKCDFDYDPGATGKFTKSERLKTFEWTSIKVADATYKIMLLEVADQSCLFEVSPQ